MANTGYAKDSEIGADEVVAGIDLVSAFQVVIKVHCSNLGVSALRNAINSFILIERRILMKIAIPVDEKSLESNVCVSFGRTPHFLIYDTDTQKSVFLDNSAAADTGGAGINAIVNIKVIHWPSKTDPLALV